MPLFEYRCASCDKTFEKLLKKQAQEVACPDCGQPAHKAVSVFAAAAASCSPPSGSGFG
jgi:putative FmdB family regulatory protein